MMKSRRNQFSILFWSTFLWIAFSVSAEDRPFLWKIEGEKPSYLFGTIHSPDPRVSTLHPVVEAALLGSDTLFTELSFDVESMQASMQLMIRDDDEELIEILGDELYARLDQTLKGISPLISAQLFEKAEIWSIFLSLSLLEHQLKYPGRAALDVVLWNKAQQNDIERHGLETPEEQVEGLEELSLREQIRILDESLDLYQEYQTQQKSPLEDLVIAYLSGDLETLGSEMQNQVDLEDETNRKLYEFLLTKRNKRMAERIYENMTTSPNSTFFFAIGAAHFWGTDSIIEILEMKGLDIARVEVSTALPAQ